MITKKSSQFVNFGMAYVTCMKVHLIKRQSIEEYAALNAGSRLPFALWLTSIKAADWNLP